MMYTTTAGSTWEAGTIDTTQQVNSISMVSTSTGFAVATRLAGNNVIWRTIDGGRTWPLSDAATTTANSQLWDIYFRPDGKRGFATGDSGVILRTTDSGATWQRMTTPTTTQLLGISFYDDNNGIAVGGAGIVLVTVDGGTTWTIRSSGTTSRSLTDVGYARSDLAFISGTFGTILRGDVSPPPTTEMTITPVSPDGADGWYITPPAGPSITLTTNRPGTTYYGWTSSAGPFSAYTALPSALSTSFSALEGDQTLYYYSVDTSNNAEAPHSVPIKTDYTPPTASALVTVTAVTTSTANVTWEDGTDEVSGVSRYDIYSDSIMVASSLTTEALITGLAPSSINTITVVTIDVAGNASPHSLPAVAVTDAT